MGANTPVIVKYPFWQMTLANEKAVYVCINYGEAFCPGEIANRSICIAEAGARCGMVLPAFILGMFRNILPGLM